MTGLGKALVMVNLLFSGFAAVWAFGLWFENVDWSEKRAQGDKEAGKIGERLTRIDALKPGAGPIFRTWAKARADVSIREDGLNKDRVWYYEQWKHNQFLATAGDPAREVDRQNNLPVLDPGNNDRPKMQATRPALLSLTAYDTESDNRTVQVITEAATLTKLVVQDTKLTEQLAGTETKKGMYLRISDERAKIRGLIEERERLQPFLTNMRVESELVVRRQKELEERIKELDAHLLRVHGVQPPRDR